MRARQKIKQATKPVKEVNMREILFKGYSKEDKEWHYGSLIHTIEGYFVMPIEDGDLYPVEEESIGQYTGFKDYKGNKIFEGDIVKYETYDEMDTYINRAEVYFDTELGAWMAHEEREEEVSSDIRLSSMDGKVEVIGNIYEKKEEQKVG